jgi:hypothetical protein
MPGGPGLSSHPLAAEASHHQHAASLANAGSRSEGGGEAGERGQIAVRWHTVVACGTGWQQLVRMLTGKMHRAHEWVDNAVHAARCPPSPGDQRVCATQSTMAHPQFQGPQAAWHEAKHTWSSLGLPWCLGGSARSDSASRLSASSSSSVFSSSTFMVLSSRDSSAGSSVVVSTYVSR